MSERDEDAMAHRARAVLDHSIDELDPVTQARLRAARQRALDALREPRPVAGRRALIATAALGSAGLAFGVSWWLRGPQHRIALDDELEDVEILTASEELEFYDDLEFYRWLESSGAI